MRRDRSLSRAAFMALVTAGLVLYPPAAQAVPQDDTAALQQKIAELEARIRQLEEEKSQPQRRDDTLFNDDFWADDPFLDMRRMRERMERMFDNFQTRYPRMQAPFPGGLTPGADLDMQEADNGYEIRLDLKGLDKEEVDVEIKKHSLTVTGQYSAQEKQQDPGRIIESRAKGSFMKTIPLPVDADTSKVETQQKGDTLVITIPKK